MNKYLLTLILSLVLPFWLVSCGPSQAPAATDHDDGESGAALAEHAEGAEGPHGGRLLQSGAFTLELAIFERGVAPEFRAWATQDGKPVTPPAVTLAVRLERLGGATDHVAFEPQGDYLRGTSEVREPHSFTVQVQAESGGRRHEWTYDSFQGRTTIEADTARDAGIVVETAGPRLIREVLPLYGVIAPDAENVREVTARYPGMIRKVTRSLGDTVTSGELLAVVESDESLRSYDVTSPIDGVLTRRGANAGEHTGTGALFTVANLATVWAELSVFPRDRARLRLGQQARVQAVDGGEPGESEIVRISPVGTGGNQALTVQVRLDNREHRWTPGLYVNAEVLIGGADVPVAVREAAVQRFRDGQVVFQNVGDAYEVRPVELGRGDGEWVEVTSGLAAGARYVSGNGFLVKADIEKSGASHDH
ncbi:MAG: efflux RND transporter periplasmic adaptor subunit [Gammaproteobacteria bacterium]|nr:efflux RND transporter periplasmic adaptor subunit [Gammaproteobacteria bacterium]